MRKLVILISTFSLVAVTLFYTSVPAFASNYVGMNDTVYKSADYWSIEELPYGEDTGVIQFQYSSTDYLTIYFDKLSIYDNYQSIPYDRLFRFAYDHYWSCFWSNESGVWDYKLNIASDSPIYYKRVYAANGVFSSSLGSLTTMSVYHLDNIDEGTSVLTEVNYPVYTLNDYSLNSLVSQFGWSIPDDQNSRRIYSNCYQVSEKTIDGDFYYLPYIAGGVHPTPTNGRQVGYNIKYYPNTEYLSDLGIRDTLLKQYNELVSIDSTTNKIYSELLTVNVYLQGIRTYLYEANAKLLNIYNLETQEFKKIDSNLLDIKGLLTQILNGPGYDSSQGIGSNTEFGDSVGGLMQDTEVPAVGTDSIVTNLGNSFLFIRTMFDRITIDLNLVYVISFLLGLSFVAYVLGRAIRNKMNS